MSKNATEHTIEARMCFNTYRLNRSFARFYQSVFADSGLTYPKYIVLSVLAENGPQSITELSEKAGVETNTLSPLLKRMANYGVINRERDPNDERRMVLTLTELGQRAFEVATEAAELGFEKLGLKPEEVATFIALTSKVQDRLEDVEPAPLDVADLTKGSK